MRFVERDVRERVQLARDRWRPGDGLSAVAGRVSAAPAAVPDGEDRAGPEL